MHRTAPTRPYDVTAYHPSAAAPEAPPLPDSLGRIYETHLDFVWRNARRLGIPAANADDVAQDVFMIVHRRFADFDRRASMQAWIFGILVRVVREHRRRFRRKEARTISIEHDSCHAAAAAASPVELAERSERVRLLDALLSELAEDERALLVLAELEGWTLREIADLYGSNTNTIYSRLRSAKRKFERVHARSRAREHSTL